MSPHAPSTALTRQALDALNAEYAFALDRGLIDRWPQFFTADCYYKVTSAENFSLGLPVGAMMCDGIGMVRDRVLAIKETAVYEPRIYRHLIGPAIVTGEDELGVASESSFLICESVIEREPRIAFVGRYVDRVVAVDGAARLRQRLAVYDNYRVFNSLIYPL